MWWLRHYISPDIIVQWTKIRRTMDGTTQIVLLDLVQQTLYPLKEVQMITLCTQITSEWVELRLQ